MITIAQFDSKRIFTGNTREITEKQGAPMGWTRLPLPEIPEGKFAMFMGTEWRIIDEYPVDPPPVISPAEVDTERDRRISAGFVFQGNHYQSRPDDRENIMGAGLSAFIAISSGVQPGDLRWHGKPEDFGWITTDNTVVPMDAFTVLQFAQTAQEHKAYLIFKGRGLKVQSPIPTDYTADSWWEDPQPT